MLDTALWSLNGGMVFFFLFFEEQQQTRPDSRWQLKVKLIGKGPAGVSRPHHWV
jgi:hypothetical protein